MMRQIVIGVVAGGIAVLVAMALDSTPQPAPAGGIPTVVYFDGHTDLYELGMRRTMPAPTALRRSRIEQFSFDETPLEEVLESLASQSGLYLVVHWDNLPFGKETPISVNLRPASAADILDAVLAIAVYRVGRTNPERIGYTVQQDTLTIFNAYSPRTFLRIYDVRDLANDGDDIGSLVAILAQNVDPLSWGFDTGRPWRRDPTGNAAVWGGRIIVEQTPDNHAKIEQVLRMLRESSNPRAVPEPAATDAPSQHSDR